MSDAGFLSLLALFTLAALALPLYQPGWPAWSAGGLLLLAAGGIAALQCSGTVGFTFLRLLCWLVFAALPLYLIISARLIRSWSSAAMGGLLLLAAGHAFLVEPLLLSVSFHRIESAKIKRPIRIVVLADIQTDHITSFERKAMLKARSLQPDLLLFPGDYLQLGDPQALERESEKFNSILKQIGITPALGAFAVGGDVEWNRPWDRLFRGTGVRCLNHTNRVDLGLLELVGLDLHDSRVGVALTPTPKFRIIFGHSPDFALSSPKADLMLAGHTHGGQVQVPFFGPLITLSRVPRKWAGGGLITLEGGRHLIVSRGLGMERGPAPRLRFNCRPEIVVVDLIPLDQPSENKEALPHD